MRHAAAEEACGAAEARKAAGNVAFGRREDEGAAREYGEGLALLTPVLLLHAQQQQEQQQDQQQHGGAGGTLPPGASTLAAMLHCNRAAALGAQGRHVDALADCYRGERVDPGHARVYHRRAEAHAALGAWEAAAQV